jgi:uncharacterized protein YqgC (DUF456 family)
MPELAWWTLAISLILIGLAGIVLPALPGVPAMFVGMLIAAWIDDFQRIGWITLTLLGILTAIAVIVDFAASVLGVKRVGASRLAMWGALAGTVIGLFFGLPGLVFGPFIGAVVGELSTHGGIAQAGRVGIATWIGLLFGTLAKLAIACAMLGVFALSFLFS